MSIEYLRTYDSTPNLDSIHLLQKNQKSIVSNNKELPQVEEIITKKPTTEKQIVEKPSLSTIDLLNVRFPNKTFSTNISENIPEKTISLALSSKLAITPEQAAGILSNIAGESSFNTDAENKEEKSGKNSAVNSDEYGIGLIQWTGDRHKKFKKYIKFRGGKTDLNTQIDYIAEEIQKDYPNYLEYLRKANNAEDASTLTYLMYVAGGKKYKSGMSIDELMPLANQDAKNLQDRYSKKHLELYGKETHNWEDRRNNASKYIYYNKKGGILKRI